MRTDGQSECATCLGLYEQLSEMEKALAAAEQRAEAAENMVAATRTAVQGAVEVEQCRWQDRLLDIPEVAAIDASGVDSADPLDYSRSQVERAIERLQADRDDWKARAEQAERDRDDARRILATAMDEGDKGSCEQCDGPFLCSPLCAECWQKLVRDRDLQATGAATLREALLSAAGDLEQCARPLAPGYSTEACYWVESGYAMCPSHQARGALATDAGAAFLTRLETAEARVAALNDLLINGRAAHYADKQRMAELSEMVVARNTRIEALEACLCELASRSEKAIKRYESGVPLNAQPHPFREYMDDLDNTVEEARALLAHDKEEKS